MNFVLFYDNNTLRTYIFAFLLNLEFNNNFSKYVKNLNLKKRKPNMNQQFNFLNSLSIIN